jgi:peptide/nickel transport system ATP-binding protein
MSNLGQDPTATPLLRVEGLGKRYRLPRTWPWQPARWLPALQDIHFELQPGRSLGVVGESGCGKSTLARLVMALETADAGQVWLDGQPLHGVPAQAVRRMRPAVQMVFQDPFGSLDPRRTVGQTVREPLHLLQGAGPAEAHRRCDEVLEAVGLHPGDAARYPHEFSGGQRQRIALARALITRPRLIVADEPVSALDVSVQAQVLNLLQDLQAAYGLSLLFISHDLRVVGLVCDELLVLDQGRVAEWAPADELLRQPRSAAAQRLLAAVPGGLGTPASPLTTGLATRPQRF